MDFIEVVRKKVAGDLEDFLLADEGAELVLEGAVHCVRDMGGGFCPGYRDGEKGGTGTFWPGTSACECFPSFSFGGAFAASY